MKAPPLPDLASRDGQPGSLGRRGFLGAVGASLALAGSEGCRRSVERIVPYATAPEQIVPGVPLHYATVYARRGDAIGLVVESHEGRPTKIEGNPLHPSSLGAVDLITQASILDLYDPDRAPTPTKIGAKSTWEGFEAEIKARLALHAKDGGTRLRLLTEPLNSPTLLRLRAGFRARFPRASVHSYGAVDLGNARLGAVLAYGRPVETLIAYDKARVIVSIDADFLQTEPGNVRAHKLFSAGRKLTSPADSISRLYVVEPALTTTGAAADHRLRLRASQVRGYAVALASELAAQGVVVPDLVSPPVGQGGAAFPRPWLAAVARDLATNRGASAVVVGSRQPPEVHALAHAMNDALGNRGHTLTLLEVTDADEPPGVQSIRELSDALDADKVDTLVILGGNPVYDAPADLAFSNKLAKASLSAHLSSLRDETSLHCTWHLPRAHELEAWGDQRALDGTLSVQQPLIMPLFDARSDIELLGLLADSDAATGHDRVRATLQPLLLEARGLSGCAAPVAGRIACAGEASGYPALLFEHDWKKALHDGTLGTSPARPLDLAVNTKGVAAALASVVSPPPPLQGTVEVVFAADPKMLDGRHANNTWLLELPDPVTKITWDNAALVSPATARELGIESGDMIRLASGARSVTVATWILPGTADGSIALTLGWGRTRAGRTGSGSGFDVYPLRTTPEMSFARGITVAKVSGRHEFARTQEHDSMEGRPLAREATLAAYQAQPHFAELQSPPRRSLPLWTDADYGKGHQWGMTIDLNACTGCSACVVACQAENNIPVVGKEQVANGRSMEWIRVDRYFTDGDEPLVQIQPIACVQCEEAPCENVCPVAALEHSPEGLSEVTYNRCIGTRYCANNCPYKVRRFNYLNWHNDGVWKAVGGLPETLQMQQNPNVTVRFRGVVEKCTYCVQRIQGLRLVAKREGRDLRDGDVVTACQQTCPADAIVFGDLNDMNSRAAKLTMGDRRYALLEELGTKPRTTYLARVRNPNPEMT